ncbi:MAG: SRPBCC domain-containing protein [Alphaproteobacteria bacterium]
MAKLDASPRLEMTRVFAAPPERVFRAWVDPKALAEWWGPENFTCTFMEFDARPGGKWRGCMVSPERKEHWVGGVVRVASPPSRLVFTWAWEDNGVPGHETLISIDFVPHSRGTEMRFVHENFATVESRDSHNGGWTSSFRDLEKLFA